MVLARIEQRSLRSESRPGYKVCDVAALVGLHRPEILVANAVLNIELLGELEGILDIGIEGVDVHEAFRIPDRNSRGRYITGKKVGQGTERRICVGPSAGRAGCP